MIAMTPVTLAACVRCLAMFGIFAMFASVAGCGPAARLPLMRDVDLSRLGRSMLPEQAEARRASIACEAGELEGCVDLAQRYLVGDGVARRPPHAFSLLHFACDEGCGAACDRLGELDEFGEVTNVVDLPNALAFYQRACRKDYASGCTRAAEFFRDGRAGTPSPRRASRWFRRGCDQGDPAGCHGLALGQLANDPLLADVEQAYGLMADACDHSYAPACVQLSVLLSDGMLIEPSEALAAVYRERACEAGDGATCTALGREDAEPVAASHHFGMACGHGESRGCALQARAYELGLGVDRNLVRAGQLYQQACEGGVSEACGRAISVGSIAGVDAVALRGLYARLCEASNLAACHYLAGLHRDGVGGPPNQDTAAELYRRSCGSAASSCNTFAFAPTEYDQTPTLAWLESACNDDVHACTVLGELHEHGFWGQAQPEIAATYYERACAGDSGRGCFRLAGLYSRGEGVERDTATAARLSSAACDVGEGAACGAPESSDLNAP